MMSIAKSDYCSVQNLQVYSTKLPHKPRFSKVNLFTVYQQIDMYLDNIIKIAISYR